MPVNEFAAESKVHPHTVYFALRGLALKERTHRRITAAIDRLKAVPTTTAG